MDTLLYIVIGAVILVVIGYFLLRRKGDEELSEEPEEGETPDEGPSRKATGKEGPAEAKRKPKTEREPKAEASAKPRHEPRKPDAESEPSAEKREAKEADAGAGDEEAEAEGEPEQKGERARAADKPRKKGLTEEERKERRKAFRKGLESTRGGFIAKLGSLLRGKKEVDAELLDALEEVLLTADVGPQFTGKLKKALEESLSQKELDDDATVWEFMEDQAREILSPDAPALDIGASKPFVIMVVGVNGVGKTTTIAKLASRYTKAGKQVVLAAGDTFRAAAVRQLEMWGDRVGAEVVKDDKQGADPASVCFKAIEQALESEADVVIADTAGRLHTKTPLMDELKKVRRVMGKAFEGAPHEVLLVLDANTGQNANQQATEFKDALGVTGLVLTKLDGTAKGGAILSICEQHRLPVRFVGVGERDDDLREFDAEDFVSVLFERPDQASDSAA